MSELYYRNSAGNSYADDSKNRITTSNLLSESDTYFTYPIYKNKAGKRECLDTPINKTNIVTLLNIRATIDLTPESNKNDDYYNMIATYNEETSKVGSNYYSSVIALTPKWNLQFLSTDFWKHG